MRKVDKINIKNIFKMTLIVMFFIASMSMTFGVVSAAPPANQLHENYVPVCSKEVKDTFRCFSEVVTDITGKPKAMIIPNTVAYGPADFLNAYNLSGKTNTNQIIAIVDAFDAPNIISDLNIYDSQFNLPSIATCAVNTGTLQSPCFQKVDQRGGTKYPKVDPGWALEISLDVEIAHAICQNCNILLVESDDNSYNNLMIAIDRAVTMGANTISNSYGSDEFASETSFDSHLNLPGKAILFSSGDSGWAAGPQYPAASPYVTAVSGTTLFTNPRSEVVWSGSGSGCSIYESKPSFQKDTGCSKRTIADVSADADPNTGANIYDSLSGGWLIVGGTSLSSPLIAGIYAQAGGFSGPGNAVPYNNYIYGTNIYDVTSGANGNCGTYICNGVPGYDGPTGLGSPIGIGAFGGAPLNSITVTSPNGGEHWQVGSTQTIKWNYTGNPGFTVEIDLLKSGSLVSVLATGVSIGSGGNGTYSWQLNSSLVPGNDYKIKIITNLGFTDTSNGNFTVSPVPPFLNSIVVSPSTASLTVGGNQKFNATALDQNNKPMTGINISWIISNSSVGSVTPISAITGADGNASTTFTGIAAGTTMINATNGSITGSASVIENTASTPIQVTNPSASPAIILNDNGRARPLGTNISRLNVTVIGNVSSVTIDLSPIGGSAFAPMIRILGTDNYTITTNAIAGINLVNNLVINATDTSGNFNNSVSIPLRVLLRGDFNGDGKIDLKDLLLLRRYLAGLEPSINPLVADIYPDVGDGNVDLKDLLLLRRYLAGLELLI